MASAVNKFETYVHGDLFILNWKYFLKEKLKKNSSIDLAFPRAHLQILCKVILAQRAHQEEKKINIFSLTLMGLFFKGEIRMLSKYAEIH